MKSFMQPKSGILRENHTSEHNLTSSPNPSLQKQRSLRKQKSSKENAPPVDPNALMDNTSSASPSLGSKSGKIKSPLPPRPPPPSNSNPLKRKLIMESVPENSVPGISDSGVNVIVRIRPPNQEEEEGDMIAQKASGNSLSILGQTFTFDSVADTGSSQQDIFQLVGAPLVENCLAGFNSSIFAYGQTGSGKTYTMWGPANALLEDNLSGNQQGLTPRVFEQLFARIHEEEVKYADRQLKYQCRCSFLEIYNEQITDLLDPNQRNLQIREDVKSGVYVENLTEECVCSMKDVKMLLIKGLSNRRTGATSINAESSRSHSVFTCVVESRGKATADGLSSFRTSRINLVDLAGSERQKLTGAAGERLKEAGNINRSLSQLGNLINILAEVSQSGKQRHIPYRDSRLTFLLQESLGGNAKLAMICAISPAQSCKSETFSTLRFAQRAKAIKNKAVVNEVMQDDVNVLREVIRQLKDELLRMKANGTPTNANGSYSTSWNARRSLNLLKLSLNRPMTLPHIEDDSDEEMEIDEEAVERLCIQVGLQSTHSEENNINERISASVKLKNSNPATSNSGIASDNEQGSDEADVNMEDCQLGAEIDEEAVERLCIQVGLQSTHSEENNINERISASVKLKNSNPATSNSGIASDNEQGSDEADVNMEDCQLGAAIEEVDDHTVVGREAALNGLESSNLNDHLPHQENDVKEPMVHTECNLIDGGSAGEIIMEKLVPTECTLSNRGSASELEKSSELGIVSCEASPVLRSPTLSVSPRANSSSRKSLRTSSMVSASQKDLAEDKKFNTEVLHPSFAHSPKCSFSNALVTQASKNSTTQTEHLAASLHRGLQIMDNHRQSSAFRRSSFRFSYKPVDLKPLLPVDKVDVGIQTLPQDFEESVEDSSVFLCGNCKNKTPLLEYKEENVNSDLQLVPVEGPPSADKIKKQVPKAVKKVLAGAIRREMALEEFCAKQTAEITQLNRLVQQYKHERECNAIIEQTREDKIMRLECLMDGVLPTEEFMEDELLCLKNEHKILKEKYENHPEILRTKIELRRVQDELDSYRNFFDMGERDVLLEEIQHLRSQLHYYIDSSSPASARKRSPLLQLTYSSEPSSAPLSSTPESTEQSLEEKFELERHRWTEAESKWISLCEELRIELEESRSLAEKQKVELDSEKKCSEELKEAMQMAMQGHARILEQYADLQEKHITLHARNRNIQEGIQDIKKAAAKAGVKGAESKFINSLAAELSALKVEREKERRYFMDEKKGLQAQLRDTAEAVQAAGELLVRLKEAEEAALIAQNRAVEMEQEVEKAYSKIDKLQKKHEREITTLNQFVAESRLPKVALRPAHNESDITKYDEITTLNQFVAESRLPKEVLRPADMAKYDRGESHSMGDQLWRQEFDTFYHAEDTELSKLEEPSSWYSGYDRCNI